MTVSLLGRSFLAEAASRRHKAACRLVYIPAWVIGSWSHQRKKWKCGMLNFTMQTFYINCKFTRCQFLSPCVKAFLVPIRCKRTQLSQTRGTLAEGVMPETDLPRNSGVDRMQKCMQMNLSVQCLLYFIRRGNLCIEVTYSYRLWLQCSLSVLLWCEIKSHSEVE